MHSLELLLASLSSIGIAHSIFMAVLLLAWQRGNRYLNRMLAVLMIAFAIRISKSVLFFLFENSPGLAPAIGVTGQAAIGPALYLYVRDFIRKDQKTVEFKSIDLLHFLPAILIALAIPFHFGSSLHYTYIVIVTHMFGYIAYTGRYVHQSRDKLQSGDSLNWISSLLIGSVVIWGVYVSHFLGDRTLLYLSSTSVAAFTLFWLSFKAMKNYEVLSRIMKLNGRDELHGVSVDTLARRLEHLFEDEKVYLDPDLSLDSLSDQLQVPFYIISKVVNHRFHQTFPEFVNRYRIREIEHQLKDPARKHLSIEGIAFDCGFNNLTAFYNVFKKYREQTPGEYRRQHLETA